jgi:serine phosphatase RsbU (regulator of sigma subunit)
LADGSLFKKSKDTSVVQIDSVISHDGQDSLTKKSKGLHINTNKMRPVDSSQEEKLFFNWFLISLLLGFLFALPYKIYFRRKRKNLTIPFKIVNFCRKTILYSPLITAVIISIPFLAQNINLIYKIFIVDSFEENFQKQILIQYWAIFILASLLTITYTYYWQKNRMQIRYLHHIFSDGELRKSIYRLKRGKIKQRLVFSSFLTSLLPLSIVVAYLLLSLTSLNDLNMYKPTIGENKVIFGQYARFFNHADMLDFIEGKNLYYINVIDTFLMFVGIGSGIFVTIIYLFSFIRWTNSDIISPVKELLLNMQKTTGGQLQNYSIVRTNDELGELSENYNIMTGKLHEYVSHIDEMNSELDQKVKERTAEVISQKEEIEAQRDEVESQRDEIERQRDYVIEQRDFILLQKKAITDSIEYAGNIQKAVLPPINKMLKILGGHFILFKPRDIVSGDFYWAHEIKSNNVIVVAADCTGHGVPGAFMSMLGITLLNEIIIKNGITSPARILDNLKTNIVSALHQTNETGKAKDGIDISVCQFDYKNKILKFAGAYNPIYIVRKVAKLDEINELRKNYSQSYFSFQESEMIVLIEIKSDRIPIGISQGNNLYTEKEFKLKENDMVYLFSDGYADQFGGERRLKFLYSRFKLVLMSVADKKTEIQQNEINEALQKWMGQEKQIDDILVMGIKIT